MEIHKTNPWHEAVEVLELTFCKNILLKWLWRTLASAVMDFSSVSDISSTWQMLHLAVVDMSFLCAHFSSLFSGGTQWWRRGGGWVSAQRSRRGVRQSSSRTHIWGHTRAKPSRDAHQRSRACPRPHRSRILNGDDTYLSLILCAFSC